MWSAQNFCHTQLNRPSETFQGLVVWVVLGFYLFAFVIVLSNLCTYKYVATTSVCCLRKYSRKLLSRDSCPGYCGWPTERVQTHPGCLCAGKPTQQCTGSLNVWPTKELHVQQKGRQLIYLYYWRSDRLREYIHILKDYLSLRSIDSMTWRGD